MEIVETTPQNKAVLYLVVFVLKLSIFTEAGCATNCSCNNIVARCSPGLRGFPQGLGPQSRMAHISGTFNVHNTIPTLNAQMLSGMTALMELRMQFCELSTIEDGTFASKQYLFRLDISDNNIGLLTNKTFSGLSSLKTLHLSGNTNCQMNDGLFSELVNLEELFLANMGLKRINPKIFVGITKLTSLSLQGNSIKKLDVNFGSLFEILKYFDISDNQLTGFTERNMQALNQTSSLILEGNPWQCNCDITWMKTMPNKAAFNPVTGKAIICAGPDPLASQLLFNIDDRNLSCIPPTIYSCNLTSINANVYDTLRLFCQIGGDPFPNVAWTGPKGHRHKFSYEPLPSHVVDENGTLTISSVTKLDEGMWTLQVFNNHGTREQRIQVKVDIVTTVTSTTSTTTTTTTTTTTPTTTQEKKPTTTPKPETKDEEPALGGSTMMIAGGAGGAGLLGFIVTIVVYVIKRSKKKNYKVSEDKNDDGFDTVRLYSI